MKKYTRLGLRNYTEFKDSYGRTIIVRQSSSATVNACWIFCFPPNSSVGSNFSPHLTPSQAKKLIKGLEEFIEEVEG